VAHLIDALPIDGFRRTHLRQLAGYIRQRDADGYYYGNRDQFEARHRDLLEFADMLEGVAEDPDARFPKKASWIKPKTPN